MGKAAAESLWLIERIGVTVTALLLGGYSVLLQQTIAAHPVQTLNMTSCSI
jgi:hypothetical protein